MKNIVVLTGAGISAESGIQTFRDSDGLWHGYDIQEVATPMAFAKNPKLVLDFYNYRRADVAKAKPNAAHEVLVKLEEKYNVQIITQNIDDLHERAGSKNILHLHGEIFKSCSAKNKDITYPIYGDINVGDLAPDGNQLRPFIVWFHEEVPMIPKASMLCQKADILIIIGTSMVVYPAAGLINYVPKNCQIIVVDKNIPAINTSLQVTTIQKPATIGMQDVLAMLS